MASVTAQDSNSVDNVSQPPFVKEPISPNTFYELASLVIYCLRGGLLSGSLALILFAYFMTSFYTLDTPSRPPLLSQGCGRLIYGPLSLLAAECVSAKKDSVVWKCRLHSPRTTVTLSLLQLWLLWLLP